jgi:hypothetical protein
VLQLRKVADTIAFRPARRSWEGWEPAKPPEPSELLGAPSVGFNEHDGFDYRIYCTRTCTYARHYAHTYAPADASHRAFAYALAYALAHARPRPDLHIVCLSPKEPEGSEGTDTCPTAHCAAPFASLSHVRMHVAMPMPTQLKDLRYDPPPPLPIRSCAAVVAATSSNMLPNRT